MEKYVSLFAISVILIVVIYIVFINWKMIYKLLKKTLNTMARFIINITFVIIYLPIRLILCPYIVIQKKIYASKYKYVKSNVYKKYDINKYEDLTRKHKLILGEYIGNSLKLRDRLIKRISISTITLDVLFDRDIKHDDEFIYMQEKNILANSDNALKELDEIKYINKNKFITFLKLNNIWYKKLNIKSLFNYKTILLSLLIIAFIISGMWILTAISSLMCFNEVSKIIQKNSKTVKVSPKSEKDLINLVYEDIVQLSNINDSVSGIIRRNQILEENGSFEFLKDDIQRFKRDLKIS